MIRTKHLFEALRYRELIEQERTEERDQLLLTQEKLGWYYRKWKQLKSTK